jgi:predicted DNA-binding transcriptional regulator AlpA
MPSKASTSDAPRRDPLPLPQARGLNREQSAAYVGVSPSKFDELVKDHFMPPPVAIGARRLWDRHASTGRSMHSSMVASATHRGMEYDDNA